MHRSLLALGSLVLPLVFACADGDGHHHEKRAAATTSARIAAPTAPLVWGDVNFIHTTDSHGWLLGHQKPSAPEPNYSGDLGTFASFVTAMKEEAILRNVDLLLIDSGDLHDGNGLTDGYPAGGVDAHDANKFVAQLPYDVMAIGNHELYIYANTLDMYQNFVPKLNGRYLSSNVNITVFDSHGKPVSVPVGERFVKFKTRLGRKVTSLGVLYNFSGNDVNTTVQHVADMVKEQWFAEAIAEEPDFFLLVGHMPVQKDNWPVVFNAVRAVHPTTPIYIFGGHTHIRDCVQLDGRSMSLESGRYLETVGWMSAKLDKKNPKANITFTRRYLDPNKVTYAYHTGLSGFLADTPLGLEVTAGLQAIAKKYDLTLQYGTAPQDYYLSRAPFPSNQSILSLLADQVLPIGLAVNNSRANIPNIMITNSGSLRFDLFQGPFTKNDQLISSPFTDSFLYIPNVPLSTAIQVLPGLNKAGASDKRDLETEHELYARGEVSARFDNWRRDQWERRASTPQNLTLGYVTQDACPGVGDDTPHSPLPFFGSPDYIASPTPNLNSSALIDLVFVDFIESDVLSILSKIPGATYNSSSVLSYTPTLASEVFGVFAQQAWN
ncbi:hypothetical protein SISSUDRAFT_695204 [Sistotremastrum suecicum HHB10207 ss-3]|uniref:Uncharacterized protein n=1 Tax=Sistotremastrum suecicum HHB10207 ss-3 TaxID=1314776 RepID=A0A166I6C5_9AGAM|nr:hypothetical protein SISSUDRAFT_695204 [Sistotremastrum suecicum HHB10207 ss-3]